MQQIKTQMTQPIHRYKPINSTNSLKRDFAINSNSHIQNILELDTEQATYTHDSWLDTRDADIAPCTDRQSLEYVKGEKTENFITS